MRDTAQRRRAAMATALCACLLTATLSSCGFFEGAGRAVHGIPHAAPPRHVDPLLPREAHLPASGDEGAKKLLGEALTFRDTCAKLDKLAGGFLPESVSEWRELEDYLAGTAGLDPRAKELDRTLRLDLSVPENRDAFTVAAMTFKAALCS